jgi:hypothetical protein
VTPLDNGKLHIKDYLYRGNNIKFLVVDGAEVGLVDYKTKDEIDEAPLVYVTSNREEKLCVMVMSDVSSSALYIMPKLKIYYRNKYSIYDSKNELLIISRESCKGYNNYNILVDVVDFKKRKLLKTFMSVGDLKGMNHEGGSFTKINYMKDGRVVLVDTFNFDNYNLEFVEDNFGDKDLEEIGIYRYN